LLPAASGGLFIPVEYQECTSCIKSPPPLPESKNPQDGKQVLQASIAPWTASTARFSPGMYQLYYPWPETGRFLAREQKLAFKNRFSDGMKRGQNN
jgi:hypothetical protein